MTRTSDPQRLITAPFLHQFARIALAFALLPPLVSISHAQTTFTRITDGEIVNDDSVNDFGCAWGDYDRDGWIDLYVGTGSLVNPSNSLFRNLGNGEFEKITDVLPATDETDSWGGVWGDYDNDGDLDLFLVNWKLDSVLSDERLYQNNGDGTFDRVLQGQFLSESYASPATWVDFNNDGFLDIFRPRGSSSSPAFAGMNVLYENTGDGAFLPHTNDIAFVDEVSRSRGAAWGDYDNDGDADLYLLNSGSAQNVNRLFRNDGDGVFTPIVGDHMGRAGFWSISADWGDYDNDGNLDLFVGGSRTGDTNVLYRNLGDGTFQRIDQGIIVEDGSFNQNTADASWADFDNDGLLDLVAVNTSTVGFQENFLYRNLGNGEFEAVQNNIRTDGGLSWSCAWADYNNDGYMDLYVVNGGWNPEPNDPPAVTEHGNNFLYRNDGNGNHWLKLLLHGRQANRGGVGAKVRVKAVINGAEVWQMREVTGGTGISQDDMRPNFGLGDAEIAEIVSVEWPSGIIDEFQNVTADQILEVSEAPMLLIESAIILSWPGDAEGYVVEAASTVDGPWMPLGSAPTLVNGALTIAVPLVDIRRFFRLAMP